MTIEEQLSHLQARVEQLECQMSHMTNGNHGEDEGYNPDKPILARLYPDNHMEVVFLNGRLLPLPVNQMNYDGRDTVEIGTRPVPIQRVDEDGCPI